MEQIIVAPTFVPVWPGVFENWAKKYVYQNGWRVKPMLDFEEATQECALVFAKCIKAYSRKTSDGKWGQVNNPKWFMALFQTSVHNHFSTLASKNMKIEPPDPSMLPESWTNAVELPQTDLSISLLSASDELKQVWRTICNAPNDYLALLLEKAGEQAWNNRICRLCGIKPTYNVLRELKTLLGQNTERPTSMDNKLSTYGELLAAVRRSGHFPERGSAESERDYLLRLFQRVSELDTKHFDKMSEQAQDWFNARAVTLNERFSIGHGIEDVAVLAPEGYAPQTTVSSAEVAEHVETSSVVKISNELGTVPDKSKSRRGRKTTLPLNAVIRKIEPGDIRRPGTVTYANSLLIQDGMTVAEVLAKGVPSSDLRYYIEVTKKLVLATE